MPNAILARQRSQNKPLVFCSRFAVRSVGASDAAMPHSRRPPAFARYDVASKAAATERRKRERMVWRDYSNVVILSEVSRKRNAVEESLIISALMQRRRIKDPSTPLRSAQDDNVKI
jgi:hypothetical protein